MDSAIVHGVDIVEVARVARMLSDHAERFRERCFTPGERQYCDAGGRRTPERYAARFAAKEAVLKALGRGLGDGLAMIEIEVTRAASGEPRLVLHGSAAAIARERGVSAWAVSLSHTETIAMASVVGTLDYGLGTEA
jgi:holo-[acyl-carrier protein] synthase